MSLMPAGYFQTMGMFRWWEEALAKGKVTPVEFDDMVRAAEKNRHWMLTPWREITLVHATQHPLEPPLAAFERLSADDPPAFSRGWGETAAGLSAFVEVNFPSTGRLDLDAAWEEPRDVPAEGRAALRRKPGPGLRPRAGHHPARERRRAADHPGPGRPRV
jgi:hypothetical protein